MAARRRVSISASPRAAPPTLRKRFFAITAKFREVLQLHARMLTRVKNASEGMIQAIARKSNAPMRRRAPIGPRPAISRSLRAPWFSTESFELRPPWPATRALATSRLRRHGDRAMTRALALSCPARPARRSRLESAVAAALAAIAPRSPGCWRPRCWDRCPSAPAPDCNWPAAPWWRHGRAGGVARLLRRPAAARWWSDRCSGCWTARSARCERARSAPVLVEMSSGPVMPPSGPGHRSA